MTDKMPENPVTTEPVPEPNKPRVIETTTGELIPVRPADTSASAPIGNFLSMSTPGPGKYMTMVAILWSLAQMVWKTGLLQQLIAVFQSSTPTQ